MPTLTAVEEKFVLHWGEMGTRWGINRTVAQIHALLYLSPNPLNAEDIARTLSVARSNVSTSLRELQGWGIVRVVHVMGDRRDHFESMKDVWEMFRVVLEQRKRREIDPTLEMLRQSVAELEQDPAADPSTKLRLKEMLDFFEGSLSLYEEFKRMPPKALRGVLRVKAKTRKLVNALLGG